MIDVYGDISTSGKIVSTRSDVGFYHTHPTTGAEVRFGVGASGYNRGIYDNVKGAWMIYADQNNYTYINNAVTTSGIYTRFAGHVVVMRMYGSRPGTVPSGYRPSSDVSIPVYWTNGTSAYHGYIIVRTSGSVEYYYVTDSHSASAPASSYNAYGCGVWTV